MNERTDANGSAGARATPLAALHVAHGARMVPFAGFRMPLNYAPGIRREHLHTRAHAGLFDVSHMGQVTVRASAAVLERVVTGDVAGLAEYRQRYMLMTDADGGIVDDVVVARLPDRFQVVVNAALREQDLAWIRAGIGDEGDAVLEPDRALLALQGPEAVAVLAALEPALATLPFMALRECVLDGHPCLVSRSGYTGEDGFEIALAAEAASALAERLLADARVWPVGLGARDSLRLEAGLCLSGADIGPDVTPAAAGLAWTVARKYREGRAEACFPGAARVLAACREGTPELRVGLRPADGIPLRAGMVLATGAGEEAGRITSGSFGPTVGHPVAMGYVARAWARPGTQLAVAVRGREHAVEVATLPFVAHRYYQQDRS